MHRNLLPPAPVMPVPELPPGSVIPDATHPSDHFPIKVVFELRSEHDRARELALEWSRGA